MSNLMLGNGDRSGDVEQLEIENSELQDRIRELELELSRTKRENARAIGALRGQLTPLYRALQAVFGEMEAIGGTSDMEAAPGAVPQRKSVVWEAWKQKLPGMPAKFIDALLVHGEMTPGQLRVVMQCRKQTVYDAASKLGKLGLLQKNGGKYSLKEI